MVPTRIDLGIESREQNAVRHSNPQREQELKIHNQVVLYTQN